jgi:uncharacterized protein YaiI (UPF0178 family)
LRTFVFAALARADFAAAFPDFFAGAFARLVWTFLRVLAMDALLAADDWTTQAASMEAPNPPAIRIFVDADACPVKPEVYRVAERYALHVFVVANTFMNVPRGELIERVIVSEGPDVADDWIVERATDTDIVVTADIPLAARCVRNGATVIGPTGKPFDDDSIGMALATRDLLSSLRSAGETTRGPKPLSRQDLSRFLSALDLAVVRLKRKMAGQG